MGPRRSLPSWPGWVGEDILRLRSEQALPLWGCAGFYLVHGEFQGDQLGVLFAYVGQGVGAAGFCPGYLSGLQLNVRRGLAFEVAAQIEIRYSYDKVGAGVVVFGDDSARLQFKV